MVAWEEFRVKRFGPFLLDTVNQTLSRGGQRVDLSPKSFAVLHHLVANAGCLLRHDELLAAVWPSTFVQPEILKTHIRTLRRALADDADRPRFIETRARLGYCFIAEVVDEGGPPAPRKGAAPTPAPARSLPGRDEPLRRLRAAVAAACTGERGVVFVTGEAGSGKTKLLDRLAQETAAGEAWIAFGRGAPERGTEPLRPLLDALGSWCRGPQGATLRRLIGQHAPECRALVASALAAGSETRRAGDAVPVSRMLRGVADLLEAMAELRPVVLLLDDLHWVDESTLALLSLLTRRPAGQRLLVVGAARPEVAGHGHPLRRLMLDLLVHRAAEEVALPPLSRSDIAAWLAREGGGIAAPQALVALVHDLSDGNAMLAAALLDDLLDGGLVVRAEGLALREAPDRSVLREAVRINRILDLALEALSAEEELVLEASAVAGRSFCTWSVYTVLEMPETTAEEHCRGLVRHGLLKEVAKRTVLPDGSVSPHFTFAHGLFRNLLHERQAVARRAVWHRRLGEQAEANWGKRAPVIAAELAYRFREGQDWRRAILYSRHAAAEALARSGREQALTLLQRAREGCRHLPEAERHEVEAALDREIARIRHGGTPAPRLAPPGALPEGRRAH
jgi:DNA-binding winged helix-turn-helix (wHTH) protein/type II secretory pathway predicted ATPase ExeA